MKRVGEQATNYGHIDSRIAADNPTDISKVPVLQPLPISTTAFLLAFCTSNFEFIYSKKYNKFVSVQIQTRAHEASLALSDRSFCGCHTTHHPSSEQHTELLFLSLRSG